MPPNYKKNKPSKVEARKRQAERQRLRKLMAEGRIQVGSAEDWRKVRHKFVEKHSDGDSFVATIGLLAGDGPMCARCLWPEKHGMHELHQRKLI